MKFVRVYITYYENAAFGIKMWMAWMLVFCESVIQCAGINKVKEMILKVYPILHGMSVR